MTDGEDTAPESALLYIEAAIGILDSCAAPPHIAAHADLARAQLEEWLSLSDMGGAPRDRREAIHG